MKNRDPYCNVSESIAAKIGVNLHQQKHHPLNIIKTKIEGYFDNLHHTQPGYDRLHASHTARLVKWPLTNLSIDCIVTQSSRSLMT